MNLRSPHRFTPLLLIALAAFTLLQRTASAVVINSVWASPAAGNWSFATNWSPQVVPNNGANTFNVTLAGTADTGPTVGAVITISSLSVPSPAALTISGTFTTGSATFGNSPNPTLQPDGSLTISSGITATLGTLANYNATTKTLTDGSFDVSGILKFTNASIITNAASITLHSTGAIRNQSNVDALATTFSANAANGVFDLSDRTFTTAGNFTNDGFLGVEAASANTTFTVPSNGSALTNFSGSTLNSGSYYIAAYSQLLTAKLAFPNASIVTN